MCACPPVTRAASMTCATARFSRPRGCICEELGIAPARSTDVPGRGGRRKRSGSLRALGVHEHRQAEPGRRLQRRRQPRTVTGGKSGEPESARKHLNPATPARAIGSSSPALPGTTPPQNATSTRHSPGCGLSFDREGIDAHRGRDAVERHVDQGRDPPSRSRPGRRRKPPTRYCPARRRARASRPGRHENDARVEVQHVPAGQHRSVERRRRGDPTARDRDGQRPLGCQTVAGDGAGGPDEQVCGRGAQPAALATAASSAASSRAE